MRCCFAASRIWEEKGEASRERRAEEEEDRRGRGFSEKARTERLAPAGASLARPAALSADGRRALVLLVHDALDDVEGIVIEPPPDELDREAVVLDDLVARDPHVPPVLEDDEGGGRGGRRASNESKSHAPNAGSCPRPF